MLQINKNKIKIISFHGFFKGLNLFGDGRLK